MIKTTGLLTLKMFNELISFYLHIKIYRKKRINRAHALFVELRVDYATKMLFN